MGDPVVLTFVGAAILLIVLSIVVRLIQRWRESRYFARRASELRKRRGVLEKRRHEIERLASRIIATSSTGAAPGFEIVRQIEAAFVDGQPSPPEAVIILKALAAQMGANAIINLSSERQPSGKCVARGDAVLVRPLDVPTEEAQPADSDPTGGDRSGTNGQ